MRKTYSIVVLPLKKIKEYEGQVCIVAEGFNTELEAKIALDTFPSLKATSGEHCIISIVPCYNMLQPEPA